MQKVVGSSPISRSREALQIAGFSCWWGVNSDASPVPRWSPALEIQLVCRESPVLMRNRTFDLLRTAQTVRAAPAHAAGWRPRTFTKQTHTVGRIAADQPEEHG